MKSSLIKIIRKFVRVLISCKENERIRDAIDRHITHIKRRFSKHTVSDQDISECLKAIGIREGDIIMVHASWRNFYNYSGSPLSFIELLLRTIGTEGTLLMPCYGDNKRFFDVNKTPSYAGVLSEEFRRIEGVKRSECSHFSVCAYGKYADYFTKEHKNSEFGFDFNSPYYLISQNNKAKIVKFGMGKYPIKLTLIHCVEYGFKDIYPYFKNYLNVKYETTVVDKLGVKHNKQMIQGIGGKLYKKNIKKVYKNIPEGLSEYQRIRNIDVRVINANAGYNEIVKLIESGNSMLNPPKTNKYSFVPLNKI
ncbi:MAG: AAC(3) family N-acetyltransferase [Syntrophaceae bacterium]|nr:AAC(3) family N-acetyltransferase [Syntrophaceae bacterium]